ncbi:phytoene desaturase family protein [Streptomyces gobiensis]|uniref:phytoene desaturase family protein n=1 Tax=Streptomyces gobiensis TaxID=2875706 RepID=UPI001E3B7D55|nr:NAD(P)/FAD-dependent oxidoreductase [Streptomyces gobiensis]UGY94210.1 NAD(P)/FAD-dependent oxidoreductase [Streptomyces gobiensis]
MTEQQPQTPREWDVVVVGAGLGGLTCAAYLAAAGRRVLLLEQHDIAGGNSHVFRRRRKFEFDVGVHYIGDCGADGIVPAILGGLGVRDRVGFREMDPDCFDKVLLPGLSVEVPASWGEYRARLRKALPDDAEGLDTFTSIIEAMGEEQRATLLAPPGKSVPDIVAMTPTVQSWGRRTLAELFDHCGLSSAARTVLAAQSPNYGMGPEQATVSMHAIVTDHYVRGAYFPEGGGQMLAATLVEVLEANGGVLRTRSTVQRVLVEDRAVRGVVLTDGTEYHAPLVVSNADFRRTLLDLVGEEHLSKPMARRTREAEMGLPFATLYLALDRELEGINEANMWWYDTDDIDAYYQRLAEGRQPDDVPFLFISFGSLKDPGSAHMCPPGHSNFQLMTLCPPAYEPWGVTSGPTDGIKYRRLKAYKAEKERFTEAMLTAAERVLGPFRDHIVHCELATPLTQERYTRSTGGTPFGVARWGRGGTRPDTGTGIRGLHVVGQSTRYGSGITGVMVGGLACAGTILERQLMYQVHAGEVVGDPSLLPERPARWDPLAISRGTARRSARGLARID